MHSSVQPVGMTSLCVYRCISSAFSVPYATLAPRPFTDCTPDCKALAPALQGWLLPGLWASTTSSCANLRSCTRRCETPAHRCVRNA